MLAALKKHLHHAIAAFWVAFSALWMMLPAIQGVMSPRAYVVFSAVVVVAFIYARLSHQEGMVDD